MADLSIIIPARNEKYLQKTVEDILEHIEGDTEVLVGLDGGVDSDFATRENNVLFFCKQESIGQRAMQNFLVAQSEAKYIMKVDAHCSFSQGFDRKMMEAMDDKTIMSPYMMRLDAENWTIMPQNPTSMYVFDTDLVMQHWREGQNEELINETMVPVGAAFMVSRENYWKWNLCDESLGSWGGQNTELGIKAYLNGGRCVTNKNVYFGHMFREKKEDFPYDRGEHPGQSALEELRKRYKNKSIKGLLEKFKRPKVVPISAEGYQGYKKENWIEYEYPANWTQEIVDNLPNA